MSKSYDDTEVGASDRYGHLEELIQQTVEVAGEIAEDALPGECLLVRRTRNPNPTGSAQQLVSGSLVKRRKALKLDESEDSQGQSQSPAPSIQEPFSPGSLAVSLDAVVEKGKTTDTDLCVLDNASTTSVAAYLGESPSNRSSLIRSSLVSADKGEHGLAAPNPSPQPLCNANAPRRLQGQSLQQKSISMVVHSGQESPLEASTETSMPQQTNDSLRHEQQGRRLAPAQEPPQCSPAPSRTSKSHRHSDNTPKRLHKTREESVGCDITAESLPSSPKWQVTILPVAPSRDSCSQPPPPPALVELEALFQLKSTAEGGTTPQPSYNGEYSYIIIRRPPVDSSPESPGPRSDQDDIPIVQGHPLQELMDVYVGDAEPPGVEEKEL